MPTTAIVEIATTHVGPYNLTLWSDNSVTLYHWMAPFEPEQPYDYIHLSVPEFRTLLLHPVIVALMSSL